MKFWQVDAFTDQIYHGNPAAVFLFEKEPDEKLMQNIAREMNLSETAFVILSEGPKIRWFTPKNEVNLCGHATLAAAHILSKDTITFQSRSGPLTVTKKEGGYLLDLPIQKAEEKSYPLILDIVGEKPLFIGSNGEDCMVVIEDAEKVRQFTPDFSKICKLPERGFLLTARDEKYDYVYRGFFPKLHVPEDPVTGSANTCLAPYWSEIFRKKTVRAFQASERTGELTIEVMDKFIRILGKAVTVFEGKMLFS